jgi:DNA repair protein RadA/Sms
MAKTRTQFLCNHCGSVHAKWIGKCPDCGTWDSLEEYKAPTPDARADRSRPVQQTGDIAHAGEALPLSEIDEAEAPRRPTGIAEFDRILGGGIVPGSVVLIGGEPGIGKSTLLLQVANEMAGGRDGEIRHEGTEARRHEGEEGPGKIRHEGTEARRHEGEEGPGKIRHEGTEARRHEGVEGRGEEQTAPSSHSVPSCLRASVPHSPILYLTSEESARQTKLRAARLGVASPRLLVLAETNLERIVNQIHKVRPSVVIVDSIQMIYKPDVPAAPGSVTQLRDCCMELVYLAKASGTAILLVGHITKAGTLAGPKIIEHIVDTVVYFEGDRFHAHRIVRCVKNRFGSTHEVGLFEMTGSGLREVRDPGKLFIEQYGSQGPPSGTVITAAMQGSRVLLVEVQALTASSVIGAAKRKTSGLSSDRVAMILAVLEKRAELRLAADDVFVNVAGGVRVIEPAIDLAVALAIASAHLNRPLPAGTIAVGELGLGGEIRSVPQMEQRLREAARLGLTHAIVPQVGGHLPKLEGLEVTQVRRLSQAMSGM